MPLRFSEGVSSSAGEDGVFHLRPCLCCVVVLQLHSDVDKGDGQVRYILTGEGAASVFSIDESTGDIHATRRLDREQQAYYTLRAQARNRDTDRLVEPESQFIIKVQDVNDNEPTFLDGPYTARVAERAPVGGWHACKMNV